MPIKDLAQRYRPQRIGKIRLGIRKKNKQGVEYPSATDYFVCPDVPGLKERYGEKPIALEIFFLFDSTDQIFPHFHKYYSASGLKCMGDGESVWYRTDARGEDRIVTVRGIAVTPEATEDDFATWQEIYSTRERIANSVRCLGTDCPLSDGQHCRPTGRLCFAIVGVPILGYFELTVHQRALLGIAGQLELAKAMFGHLTGIPFNLHLSQETVQVNGKARKIYTPWIAIDPVWMAQELPKRLEHKRLMGAEAKGDVEDLYGTEDVEDLDYEQLPAGEIENMNNSEDGDEDIVPDPWTALWGFAKGKQISDADVKTMLEATGGEPLETLKRLKKKFK